jgi:Peptidase C39 family
MKSTRLYRQPMFPLALLCAFFGGAWPSRASSEGATPPPTRASGQTRGSPFSPNLTDAEIFQARLFDEPLIPVGGEVNSQENAALADSMMQYNSRTNRDDFSSLTAFLQNHPVSRWRGSLLLHLGTEYYLHGYYSRALATWEEAWTWWQQTDDLKSKPQADRVLGELARMYSRLGRTDQLSALLDATKTRNLTGPGTQLIGAAHAALWMMKSQPDFSFRCGPLALEAILAHTDPRRTPNRLIMESKSSTNGCSLSQVTELSRRLGLNYQAAFRSPGSPLLFPAVVHWKVGHYAAIIQPEGDCFLVNDYTFPSCVSLSASALEDESSGYFLVPSGPLPAGWRPVSESEAHTVWGRGVVGQQDPNDSGCDDICLARQPDV